MIFSESVTALKNESVHNRCCGRIFYVGIPTEAGLFVPFRIGAICPFRTGLFDLFQTGLFSPFQPPPSGYLKKIEEISL